MDKNCYIFIYKRFSIFPEMADYQGGKKFRQLKEEQEKKLDEINRNYLDDPDYGDSEDYPDLTRLCPVNIFYHKSRCACLEKYFLVCLFGEIHASLSSFFSIFFKTRI